jgi:hypothetical protein
VRAVELHCQADRQRKLIHGGDGNAPLTPTSHRDPDIDSDAFWNQYCLVDTVTISRVDSSACDYTMRGLPLTRPMESLLLQEPAAGHGDHPAGAHVDATRIMNVRRDGCVGALWVILS